MMQPCLHVCQYTTRCDENGDTHTVRYIGILPLVRLQTGRYLEDHAVALAWPLRPVFESIGQSLLEQHSRLEVFLLFTALAASCLSTEKHRTRLALLDGTR